ncbi:MAG: SdpI family protein [Clostridia bacterium]|nr:SdpI family protein [Clostridia bacterium]
MTNKNKIKLLISSIVIILPTLAALILKGLVEPKVMGAWHFTWVLPVILVAVQVILHLVTFRENKEVEQNKKIVEITYWIIPALSVYISGVFMLLSLGYDNLIGAIFSILFGLMFIILGNYTPKAVRNRSFGVKIKWTLANEENWNATHRVTGKVWVITGLVVLLGAFLPEMAAVYLILVAIIPTVFIPVIYSYCFYKKQLRDGTATKEDYASYPKSKVDKKVAVISTVIGSLIVVGIVIMMFVGSITFTLGDTSLEVDTTYGGGMTLDYEDIESVEYVEGEVSGMRVSGFASGKLLWGWFKNDELGSYTRYTYTDAEATLIIRTADGIIVIADETAEETKALYDSLLEKVG